MAEEGDGVDFTAGLKEVVDDVGPRDGAREGVARFLLALMEDVWLRDGPRIGRAFKGVLEGMGVELLVLSSSAPDRRKPSKRPEIRRPHSWSLTAARVAKTLWMDGLVRRYMADSGSRGGAGRR